MAGDDHVQSFFAQGFEQGDGLGARHGIEAVQGFVEHQYL
jgi:hypothetical protein